MAFVLLLCSAALILVALAVELWGGAAAREQRRLSLQHAEQRLSRPDTAPRLAGISDAPPPPMPVTSTPAGLPWDALMRRAALPTGWRVPLLIVAAASLLAWIASARLGTVWAAPIVLVLSALAAWFWVSRRITRLQAKMLRQLPDFLDNLVRLAGLGNSLQMAFQTSAARSTRPTSPTCTGAAASSRCAGWASRSTTKTCAAWCS